ncbi:hypothetical protein THIAE_05975 [Thiomicrospira aerophila AL3]|uniref:Uncharacterized protein n=1 Tax=Thiomicrospira aerophila AL3 TaxID=717772 RepID=W0DZ68_9GAMM|nr:hypothetical protein [Thiomicrospira aerophila]AHF02274.1 hypothetical protein THIAE_05975 [Thiomicrospira aerophila AL3]
MKYLVLMAVLFSPIVHAEKPKNVLPDNWSSHVYGIKVSESDLGRYFGMDQLEDEAFHFFWNEIKDSKGAPLFCFYPVHAEHYYIGMVYCTGLRDR